MLFVAKPLLNLAARLWIDLSELCLYLALLPQELFIMAHTVLGLPNYQRWSAAKSGEETQADLLAPFSCVQRADCCELA